MAQFKCKMCGGILEIASGDSIATCDYCGTCQTLPRLDDERISNLYSRANYFRYVNEFDKAMAIYEQILEEDNTDAEAYWSIVLCRYGIEYVEDPETHLRVPTVNRTQFTSVLADEDYKSALAYADLYQRGIYEREAETINEIQKGILLISDKEAPYDIFVCYKETDENGKRTSDSVAAQDLYQNLTNEGFKVFFSRITLEDKLGLAYEPYIFSAINSAKVMIVVGTSAQNLNSAWVKNEWSRFLALIKKGEKKTLIPAYKDMDPHTLPIEFSHLQAQDMSKIGFMQDIIHGIKKLVTTKGKRNKELSPIIEKAFAFLKEEKWNSADEFAEKALEIDNECAEAYIVKLFCELNIHTPEQIKTCKTPIDKNINYLRALRFSDGEYRKKIEEYNIIISENIEFENKEIKYNTACALMDEHKYEEAILLFSEIKSFKAASEKIEYCEQAKEAEYKENIYVEALRVYSLDNADDKTLEKSIAALKSIPEYKDSEKLIQKLASRLSKLHIENEKRRKRRNKIIIACVLCAVVFIILISIFMTLIMPRIKFDKADALFSEGKYFDAYEIYEKLDNFSDSKKRIAVIEAIYKIEENLFDEAILTLISSGIKVQLNYNDNTVIFDTPSEFSGLDVLETNVYYSVKWFLEEYSYDIKEKDAPFYLKLKIVLSEKDYVIEYDLNGGTVDGKNATSYNKNDESVTLINPIREGYTFAGWIGTGLAEPTINVTIPKGSYGDRKYTAMWTPNTYTLTFDPNGGSVSKTSITVTYNEHYELPIPTKIGYVFGGWYAGDVKIDDTGIWKSTESKALTVKWTPANNTPFKVKHYLQNADDDEYTLKEIEYYTGTTDAYVAPPRKEYEGYISPSAQITRILPDGSLEINYYYERAK